MIVWTKMSALGEVLTLTSFLASDHLLWLENRSGPAVLQWETQARKLEMLGA